MGSSIKRPTAYFPTFDRHPRLAATPALPFITCLQNHPGNVPNVRMGKSPSRRTVIMGVIASSTAENLILKPQGRKTFQMHKTNCSHAQSEHDFVLRKTRILSVRYVALACDDFILLALRHAEHGTRIPCCDARHDVDNAPGREFASLHMMVYYYTEYERSCRSEHSHPGLQ